MEPTINKIGTCWFWQIFKIRRLQKQYGFYKWYFLGMYRYDFDDNGHQTYASITYIDLKPFPRYRCLKHEKGHHEALRGCHSDKEAEGITKKYDKKTWHGFLQLLGYRSWDYMPE